jgi:soluble cytochrome b562
MTSVLDDPPLSKFEIEMKRIGLQIVSELKGAAVHLKEIVSDQKMMRKAQVDMAGEQAEQRHEQRQANGNITELQVGLQMLQLEYEEGFKRIIARLDTIDKKLDKAAEAKAAVAKGTTSEHAGEGSAAAG